MHNETMQKLLLKIKSCFYLFIYFEGNKTTKKEKYAGMGYVLKKIILT